ncbi:hypothetical protein AVEN_151516-1 [Araneus ventricosus]|uniref:Uncharacterized protein n=1 Tax=Araneus ventricosus TaxID=182803 RepID=A0A4Y2IDI4_ARAVE|nr:hypothetical protein AVEN_151516-1 [Araneus ventricosus]
MKDLEICQYLNLYYKPKLKILQEKLGNTDLHTSNRLLESFRKRHGISFKAVCSEAGDVSDETVNTWIEKIEKLIEGHEPQNIANADENEMSISMILDEVITDKFRTAMMQNGVT